MQTEAETPPLNQKLERVGIILRIVGWLGFWVQLALAAASGLLLLFAIGGNSFNRAVLPVPGIPGVGMPNQGATPGIGIGIFWAVCGTIALLVNVFLAFQQTRYARRLRNPEAQVHPKRADVVRLLRLGTIVSLVGMLLTILGCGATLGILLSKVVAQPQGAAIYDPTRLIRSLDIFVAMANMNGIAAHFIGMVAALGLLNWLDPNPQSAK